MYHETSTYMRSLLPFHGPYVQQVFEIQFTLSDSLFMSHKPHRVTEIHIFIEFTNHLGIPLLKFGETCSKSTRGVRPNWLLLYDDEIRVMEKAL